MDSGLFLSTVSSPQIEKSKMYVYKMINKIPRDK